MKLQPDKQFKHSMQIVTKLAEQYGLKATGYREPSLGIENTTLIVKAVDTKAIESTYVFRIYRQGKKSYKQIQAEIDFMAYLRQKGIPVPDVLPNSQKALITIFPLLGVNWQVIIMEFIEGEHTKAPSTELLAAMATTQARMHLLAVDYPKQTDNIRKFTELVETEFIPQIDQSKLVPELRDFLQRATHYKVALNDNLPTGPCHLDYDEQNILCQKSTISAVLDFDDISVVPYVVCLAYTLWHVHDLSGVAALDTYLKIYQQLRPLTSQEQKLLDSAILFRHYMISAIKVLDGQTSSHDIQAYVQTESYILSRTSLPTY